MDTNHNQAHILIVDDDERIRNLLQKFLLRNGFFVSVGLALLGRLLLHVLLVTLLGQGRRDILGQNGHVKRVGDLHGLAREGEPGAKGSRISGSREIEVLPAGIEDGLAYITQTLGKDVVFTLFH